MGIVPDARLLLNPPLSDYSGAPWLNPQRVVCEAASGYSQQTARTSDAWSVEERRVDEEGREPKPWRA